MTNNTPTYVELSDYLDLLGNATPYYIVAAANDSAPNYDNSSDLHIILTDPSLHLEVPENNYYDNDGNINFTFHYRSLSFDTMNCSLYLNGILNQTNSTTLNSEDTIFVVTGINEPANPSPPSFSSIVSTE